MKDINYFVCTLGQAALVNTEHPHTFETINEFLDVQNEKVPSRPAVGFPIPSQDSPSKTEWGYEILSFHELRRGANIVAHRLRDILSKHGDGAEDDRRRTVALICPSSPVFLFAWLGLMRLGYSVLLIAPQCQPSAIAHLCKTCNVSILFYDQIHEALAKDACSLDAPSAGLQSLSLPCTNQRDNVFDLINQDGQSLSDTEPLWRISEHDVAYLHHTSGTSTGLPKPIAQTHHAGVCVLPCLSHGSDQATFTTTPLYHGGVADCFRAWTSDAMIWLFPGKEVPITAGNVLKSLKCAQAASREHQTPMVRYFSSVPYVLQMIAAEQQGLNILKDMEIVGVGGAALPQAAGDELVEKEINLVSRFGSAECGFLMSSHRDYGIDKDWQYLRADYGSDALSFEPQDDGLAELVILPQWPHMAKTNREDGSFATADLFAPHPSIPNAWKYHSRADSQLTLITGKKFDPAPLEAAIATSPLLSDVLIFGNGQQYPGALLFRSSASAKYSDAQLVEQIWPYIEKLNAEGQGHTRLSRSMLAIMPPDASGLEKSSKGTVLRGQAETTYRMQIGQAYKERESTDTDLLDGEPQPSIPDDELPAVILHTIKSVIDREETIPAGADLFSHGLDSVACMQIRAILQKKLLPQSSSALPLNVVYDCGSIDGYVEETFGYKLVTQLMNDHRLSKYLIGLRNGKVAESEDETRIMRELVGTYGTFSQGPKDKSLDGTARTHTSSVSDGDVVILTGATGALGAHILDQLRSDSRISQIYCLVRAADPVAAKARVNKSLLQRRKAPLNSSTRKVHCVIARLAEPSLGLSTETHSLLAERTTLIIHAAWAVNFSMRLQSFVKDHIAGLRNLFDLAIQSPQHSPPRFVFCSSTASVLGPSTTSPIAEHISHDPNSASPLGYSRSKWVSEAICEQASLHSRLNGRITVLRIGQLCGDTQSGVWNVTEAWPLMLSSIQVTGSLPALEGEKLAWLPVDIAAKAVVQIAFQTSDQQLGEMPVYHLVNEDRTTTWMELLDWMKRLNRAPFKIVSPREWVEQLENLKGEAAKHPARKLLGLWKGAYCKDDRETPGEDEPDVEFAMEGTKRAAPAMRDVKPISEEQFEKIWQWMEQEMLDGKMDGKEVEKSSVVA